MPEDQLGSLFAWADVLVLPYKEASQSGVAPAAIAAGRLVVSTRVGGLAEQLSGERLATLCEPDATNLAAALRGVLVALPDERPHSAPVDPRLAWRDAALRLLAHVADARFCPSSSLPGLSRPSVAGPALVRMAGKGRKGPAMTMRERRQA